MKFVGNAVPSYPSALSPANPEDIADKAYVDSISTVKARITSSVTANTSLTTLMSYTVPANSVAVGDTFIVKFVGTMSGAGNPTFSVSCPGGVIWTSNAVSAAAAAGGWCEAMFTVKAIGASGSVAGHGFALVSTNQGSITLPSTRTVDTTASWLITAQCQTSAATFVATSGIIQKL